jgi:glycosyltransferase involved in cell wall biosynthesis
MNTPQISFVVPSYNYGRFLPDCLDSIFAQQGNFDFEVIVIDDCSSDNSVEIIRRYQDPRMRVILHSHNQGHIITISEGIQAARGELVARIDCDDRYRPYFLQEVVPRFEAYPEVGLVYGDVDMINAEGVLANQPCDRVHGGKDFKGNEYIALLRENFICAPTVIARKKVWMEALPVPAQLDFSDWWFNLMIARRHELYYRHRILAEYRVHSQNHHTRIIHKRTEEPSIRYVLDLLYSQTEADPHLERMKQQARAEIYSNHYRVLADKYFYLDMTEDARRCYWKAVQYHPARALGWTLMRRYAASYLQRSTYEKLKHLLKSPA